MRRNLAVLALLLSIFVGFGQSQLSAMAEPSTALKLYFERRRQLELDQLEREKLDLERQRLEMQRSASEEALQLERERLAAQKPPTSSSLASDPEAAKKLAAEIDTALLSVNEKYPDLKDYLPEMQALANLFTPGNSPATTLEKYFEGLYVISKYASFSSRASALRDAKPMTNDDIIALSKAGLDAETIILRVKTCIPQYSVNTDDLLKLKTAKVADSVIRAMIERGQ
jgi:hypothetical protein